MPKKYAKRVHIIRKEALTATICEGRDTRTEQTCQGQDTREALLMVAIDSEFQSLIPPLSDDEYQRLEKSILAEGVRDPIITWNGTIIDGHNRYHICDEHGIEFRTTEREFASRDAAKIWIIENQFGRRNLSTYDRSVLALQLEGMYAAEAKKRKQATQFGNTDVQKSAPPSDMGKTRDKVAAIAGVSHDTIRKVKVIETEAAKGNEAAMEAREAVKSGEKSIHKAFIEARAKRPSRRAKVAEDGRRICSICGEPIDEGAYYQDKLNWHYECGLEHSNEMQRRYRDADHDLRNNTPAFTIDSLLMELQASAEDMRSAWEESLSINESMGVRLTHIQRKRLNRAVTNMFKQIESIRKEANNG